MVIAGSKSAGLVLFLGYNTGGATTIPSGGLLTVPAVTTNLPVSGTLVVNGGTILSQSGTANVGVGWTANYAGTMTINSGLVNLTGCTFDFGHGTVGTLNLNGGQLDLSKQVNVEVNRSNAFNFNGGTLQLTGAGAAGNLFNNPTYITTNVGNGGAIIDVNGNSATISNSLIASGSGGLTLLSTAGGGGLTLSGSSNYSGGTTISGGLAATGQHRRPGATSGTLTMSGGTLDLHGFSPTIGGLAGGSGYVVANGAATLTVSSSNNSTYGGVIANRSANTALAKAGSGRWS